MSGRANHEWSGMGQSSTTNFFDGTGLAEINNHIAVLHRRLNWIADVAQGYHVDIWFGICDINNRLPHASFCTNEENPDRFHRLNFTARGAIGGNLRRWPSTLASASPLLRDMCLAVAD
jgi:hypothetical protein